MDRNELLNTIEENQKQLKDIDVFNVDKNKLSNTVDDIRDLFFPGYITNPKTKKQLLDDVLDGLEEEIRKTNVDHKQVIESFSKQLPVIQNMLYKDVQAMYDGDPSAKTISEIVSSFPGFYGVLSYRVAHYLYELNVPIIPRVISEIAHDKTGIDINPGAKIGEYFCIDHGTGIVIGETATVGNHVRMYHGVTLGVRSFKKDEKGNLLKGGKRHPDIGNHVIIYANATILGGDTRIEDNSVIPTGSLIIQTPETFKD